MTEPPGERYIWHGRMHEEWANERLYFWRFAFYPNYRDERVREGVSRALSEHDVRSYAMYELLGFYDVVLRVWLPTRVTQAEFEKTLTEQLAGEHLQACDVFSVGEILRHWPWCEPGSESPTTEFVASRQSDEWIQLGNTVASGAAGMDVEEYIKAGALAPCNHKDGIKFIVVITSSSQILTVDARGYLRDRLMTIAQDAGAQRNIYEVSLYEGSGFCQFLLLGKVDAASFFDLRTEIIDKINRMGADQWFGARTYTYVSATDTLPLFEDVIPTIGESAPRASAQPVEKYLNEDESQSLEVKASAFADVDRWVHTGKTAASDKITNEGVLRAVVGMLNADGGTIVIGAIEKKKYPDWEENERLKSLPQIGQYFCCGIELDFEGQDWDRYARRLQQVVNSRINPPPTGLVTIVRAQAQQPGLTGAVPAELELCVITVQTTEREWFYLCAKSDPRERFFVRGGGETREYSGPLADGYKRIRRRE